MNPAAELHRRGGPRDAEGEVGGSDQGERDDRHLGSAALAMPEPEGQDQQTDPAGNSKDVQWKERETGADVAPREGHVGDLIADRHEPGRRRGHRGRGASPTL